ncbi:MAG TPA: NAD(P)/FAD-dependent oxidoreductase [Chloroflexia bacterium]|nr:NAD(P)/FAD-dependent oxidoreductase [Chloroflexia bacterium]
MSKNERRTYDAVIVGAGPNGLAAAITLARAGRSVLVLEGKETIGGGSRSAALTLPGFTHDVCSAIHPLGLASPFMRSLPLQEHGLEWIHPSAPLAHPLDDGTAIMLERTVAATGTSANLGRDGKSYRKLMGPLVRDWHRLAEDILGPLRFPRHPIALARFGVKALLSASLLAKMTFKEERARAIFAGMAAHSMLPLERPPTASFGLVLATLAHVVGWPVARGGSQQIANAMASYFCSLGGEIVTGRLVESLDELPTAQAVLFDVTPRQLLQITGDHLPPGYRRQLRRYRYGPGVFKVDWALDGPIPWKAEECARAATVHLGGTIEEIAASERAIWHGQHYERPFVLLAQQSLFDATRAPEGKHTVWAYCHVPHGSALDMTERIEGQVARFAPGFRDRVLARHTMSAPEMQQYNPNYIGGDINGGIQDLRQLFTRPTPRLTPYRTPARGIYICSSSTPPGGGVHGMCGHFAARTALGDLFR